MKVHAGRIENDGHNQFYLCVDERGKQRVLLFIIQRSFAEQRGLK
jgi:hypothetical protein